jgi:hypothetical protein
MGIAALCFALCAVAVMIAVPVVSNERPISDWTVQPSVLLALATTTANILICYALAKGLTVAWWVKAMRGDVGVKDLHNVWAFSTSLKEALLSGLLFNLTMLGDEVLSSTSRAGLNRIINTAYLSDWTWISWSTRIR